MADRCKICYDKLPLYKHNRQVYCEDKNCKQVGKETASRVLAQRRAFNALMTKKQCKRCLKYAQQKNMRTYCDKCKEEIKMGIKICVDCEQKHNRNSNRCEICAKKRHKEQVASFQRKKKLKRFCRLKSCGKELKEDAHYSQRYCDNGCFQQAQNEKIARKKVEHKVTKTTSKKKKDSGIDPKFLVRGDTFKTMSTGVSCMNG